MISTRTAFTHEIDDCEQAVAEIMQQLALEDAPLLANSVGLIACYAEYIDSGVVAALHEALPFDIIGATSIANSVPGSSGETMLSLMVLTSDDVTFATATSAPMAEEAEAPLAAMYAAAAEKLAEKPVVMLSYAPLLTQVGGDFYVDTMSKISGNLPNFGTLAVDHNADYHDSRVLLNDEAWTDRFAILLMAGNVQPHFYVGTISDARVFPERGAVTAAKGNQLQTIDGMPATDYLLTLGLEKNEDGGITGINTFPIIVDYNDGTKPVARAMFASTPDGCVVCGGNIPVGSTFSIGSFDPDEICDTSARTIQHVLAKHPQGVLLLYSCIGRFFAQGYNQQVEMKAGNQLIEDAGRPFLGAYSGGELCPVYKGDGTIVNRNHNNSLVICVL